MHILVVDDEKELADSIKKALEGEGFAAHCIYSGQTAKRHIEINHGEYDLIVLDVMLGDDDGFEVCKYIRSHKIDLPILMLTAKNVTKDIVTGLESGADDYLTKPFSLEELIARIQVLLKRPRVRIPEEATFGTIKVNLTEKKVYNNNKIVDLTLKEFSLLEYFIQHPRQVLNREQILSHIWDFEFESFSNIVDVHVKNLRKKLGPQSDAVIETVRGVGYRFNYDLS